MTAADLTRISPFQLSSDNLVQASGNVFGGKRGIPIQTYCERCGPGLFDEPINAGSNVVFLIAAWLAWRAGKRFGVLTPGLWTLIGLSASVGAGSALWHTFATPWAMVLDIVPIMLFQFAFLWLYGTQVARLPTVAVGLGLAVYVGIGFLLREYKDWLNGVPIYAPALALAWATGIHYCLTARRGRFMLLGSATVFCLALMCRTIDLVVCRQLPVGTHFLWHVLNGVVVYSAMWVIVTVWADRSPEAAADAAPSNGGV